MTFGFVKDNKIQIDDMIIEAKKRTILDSLYTHCQIRTHTSKDVLRRMLVDLGTTVPSNKEDEILLVIRNYKNTGKELESTVNMIYSILYSDVS